LRVSWQTPLYKNSSNAFPVKPCAFKTIAKKKTFVSIGFTGLLATVTFYFFREILGILSNLAEW